MSAAAIALDDWPAVARWRRQTRARLLAARQALPGLERRRASADVALSLLGETAGDLGTCVALYWPIRGELDLRALAVRLHAAGVATALPVVVARDQPMEFWRWAPDTALERGIGGIPVPVERRPMRPTAIVAPLLGFDAAGYRLGYGGGYYDRTLASLTHEPLVVGVGHEAGRLPSIRPQPHDVPMGAIVTPAGCWRRSAAPTARETGDVR